MSPSHRELLRSTKPSDPALDAWAKWARAHGIPPQGDESATERAAFLAGYIAALAFVGRKKPCKSS